MAGVFLSVPDESRDEPRHRLRLAMRCVLVASLLLLTLAVRAQQCANDTFELLEADSRVGFGRGVAAAGDVDGDGEGDFGVVSICDTSCVSGPVVQLISGRTGGVIERHESGIKAALGDFPISPLAALGDIDDDGFDDYAVTSGGDVSIVSGQTLTSIRTLRQRAIPSRFTVEDFGLVVSSAGDFNDDGAVDIAVAAPTADISPLGGLTTQDAGVVFVFSGSNGALLETISESRAGQGLGSWVAPAGDLDDDGFDDLIVAPRQSTLRGSDARVFSGQTGASILTIGGAPREAMAVRDLNDDDVIDILAGYPDAGTGGELLLISGDDGTTIRRWTGKNGSAFGHSVAVARDLNFDGLSELIVGSPFDATGGLDSGHIFVYSGGDGRLIADFTGAAGDLLGVSVAAATNLLSKETPAVIAGRPSDDDEGGGAQVFFITADLDDDDVNDLCDPCTDRDGDGFGDPGFPDNICDVDNCPTIYNPGQEDTDGDGLGDICACHNAEYTFSGPVDFGVAVAGGGDVDDDGHDDVAVGAEGKVFVYSGSTGAEIYEITGLGPSFGRGVAIVDDMNGDDHDEIVIGEPGALTFGRGVVWTYSGATGTLLHSLPVTALNSLEELGHVVSAAGDVNRDGAGDYIAGVDGGGVVLVVSGLTGTLLWDIIDVSAGFGNSVTGTGDVNDNGFDDYAVAGETKVVVYDGDTNIPVHTLTFADGGPGTTVSAAGDVNFDGFFDFLVGTPDSDVGGADAGEAFVISGADASTLYHFTGTAAGDQLGIRVSAAGDTNGDGFGDFVVGQRVVDGPDVSIRSLVYSGKSGALWYAFPDASASADAGRNVAAGGDIGGDGSASLVIGDDVNRTVKVYSFGDGDEDEIVDACDECPDIYNLQFGVQAVVDLTSGASERQFKIEPDLGKVLTIDLRDQNVAGRNTLYARWGDPASRRMFDLVADRDFQSSQRLVIPHARADVLHLLARATRIDGSGNEVIILVQQHDLALTSLSIERDGASDNGLNDATILGGGFDDTTVFELVHQETGERISGQRLVIVNADRATAAFDTSGATPGHFDLEATKGDTTRSLLGVFERTPSTIGAVLDARLNGPGMYRDGRTSVLTLTYTNRGDAQMLAPVFKVTGPPQARLGLERGELGGNEILVIGVPPKASAGILPAGARGSVPIIFESTQCQGCLLPDFSDEHCVDCKQSFTLEVFEPSERDFIPWAELEPPEGIRPSDWTRVWTRLAVDEGIETWLDFHEALSRTATRLAARGGDATSLVEVFNLLLRDAQGLPNAAIVGRLRDASGTPIGGERVLAFASRLTPNAAACAVTDANGGFALEGLSNGRRYEIASSTRVISGRPSFTLPSHGDLTGVELEASKTGNVMITICPNADRKPADALEPPGELFRPADSWRLLTIAAWDPNDKDGPIGPDDLDELAVPPGALMQYNIRFENKEEASAAATRVDIYDDELDPKLDWTTFEFQTLQIGSQVFQIASEFPEPLCNGGLLQGDIFDGQGGNVSESSFNLVLSDLELIQIDGDDETTVCMDIDFTFDLDTGDAHWALIGTPLDGDLTDGLLPPNENPPEGEGKIVFTVSAKKDLDDGDEIENDALIVFDGMLPGEDTGPWINTISHFLASPASDPFPAHGDTEPVDTHFFWHADGAAVEYTFSLWKADQPDEILLEHSGDIFEGAGLFQPTEPLDEDTQYRWRVDLENSLDIVTEGPEWAFSTLPPPEACPPAASTPQPTPGSTIDGESVALSWNGPDADSFRVYLAPSEDLGPETVELGDEYLQIAGLVEPNYEHLDPLASGTEFTWQVRSVNADCEVGAPSQLWTFETMSAPQEPFRRCDANGDGTHDIADAVGMLFFLFLPGGDGSCRDSIDCDDNGELEVNDPVSLLNVLFLNGPQPPEPYGNCGDDAGGDALGCAGQEACEG